MRTNQEDELNPAASDTVHATGWSQTKQREHSDAKTVLGEHFAAHDFLVEEGRSPETDPRRADATIFVAPGTTPNRVLTRCLAWMLRNWVESGPFHITWYTGGALVAASLQEFRETNPGVRPAASVHLLPGTVDSDVECVLGPAAVNYVTNTIQHCFTTMFLSAYSFDLASGQVFFHFDNEVEFQGACARLPAQRKFIFLDSAKLRRDGCITYDMASLFEQCTSVTIYIGLSETDDAQELKKKINDDFDRLVQSESMGRVSGSLRICVLSGSGPALIDKSISLSADDSTALEEGPKTKEQMKQGGSGKLRKAG